MKKIALFTATLCLQCENLNALEALSAASGLIPKIFGGLDEGVNIKKLTAYSFDDTNNGAPVKIHLVIVFNGKYAAEAKSALDQLTASEYSEQIGEIKKKYPETLRCASWEIMAKKGVHPLSLQNKDGKEITDCGHFTIEKAYIFAEHYPCSKVKPQMAVVPSPENISIYLDKDTFLLKSQTEIEKVVKERQEAEKKASELENKMKELGDKAKELSGKAGEALGDKAKELSDEIGNALGDAGAIPDVSQLKSELDN